MCTPNRVYKVIREDCYDNDPSSPWRHQGRVAQKALTTEAMRRRLDWGKSMQPLPHTEAWYYHNLVWTDICNSVLPRSAKKANEQALARKGGKGWISSDSKYHADNMRGDANALKLSGAGTERVHWAPILSRGKLHVEMLPRGFPGETEAHFEHLQGWVERMRFDRLGCFTYSHEENTHAYTMNDDVPEEVKRARVEKIMDIQAGISEELNVARIGSVERVLIDRHEDGLWVGRTQYDSPDVDNEVRIAHDGHLRVGDFVTAKITGASSFDLDATLLD